MWRPGAALFLVLLLVGVSRGGAAQTLADCELGAPPMRFDTANVAAMADQYELRLVSTEQAYPSSVTGRLELAVADSQQRHFVRYPGDGSWQTWLDRPLIGWAEINVGAVGGGYSLDPASRKPGAPGATVNRFGTLSLGSQPYLLDGLSTELTIKAVGPRAFRGTWLGNHGIAITIEQGTNRVISPGGWFCATRLSD